MTAINRPLRQWLVLCLAIILWAAHPVQGHGSRVYNAPPGYQATTPVRNAATGCCPESCGSATRLTGSRDVLYRIALTKDDRPRPESPQVLPVIHYPDDDYLYHYHVEAKHRCIGSGHSFYDSNCDRYGEVCKDRTATEPYGTCTLKITYNKIISGKGCSNRMEKMKPKWVVRRTVEDLDEINSIMYEKYYEVKNVCKYEKIPISCSQP